MLILTLEYLQCWNHQELPPHRMAASVVGEPVCHSAFMVLDGRTAGVWLVYFVFLRSHFCLDLKILWYGLFTQSSHLTNYCDANWSWHLPLCADCCLVTFLRYNIHCHVVLVSFKLFSIYCNLFQWLLVVLLKMFIINCTFLLLQPCMQVCLYFIPVVRVFLTSSSLQKLTWISHRKPVNAWTH